MFVGVSLSFDHPDEEGRGSVQTQPQRFYKLDNLKLILIFLVVLGHVADLYADASQATGCLRFIIYTFHMPLFLFVSGLVSKRNIRERRYSHIATYFFLFVFIKAITFAANWATTGNLPPVTLFADRSEPWYAFCLFAFSMITIMLDKLKPAYVLIFSVLLACYAGYDKTIGDQFNLSRILVFYPFFYLGYWLDAEKVCAFFSKKRFIPIALAILAIGIMITVLFYDRINYAKYLFTGRQSFHRILLSPEWGVTHRLLCYAVSVLAGGAVLALAPERKLGFLTGVGSRSVQIYALQRTIMILYFRLLNKPFHLEGYFTSKLILYEILVSLGVTAVCALPLWNPLFRGVMHSFQSKKTAAPAES